MLAAVLPCPPAPCASDAVPQGSDAEWFAGMIDRCYDYAGLAKAEGRPVVGILCEYTPRELIIAAGGVPVCLCGGSADRIPAAEQVLPSNLCPLIKSTFGYHLERNNPFLEWADLVVAETTCDGKKKMFELMAETRPMFVLSLPHNREAALGREQWVAEMRRLRAELERRFHVRVTDEKLRAAIRQMNHERRLRRELAALMRDDEPPFTGRQLLEMKSIISCIPADIERYKNILSHAVEKNATHEGDGSNGAKLSAGRVRVLLTGVPVAHGAERVVDLIEDHGGLIVCQENCTGLKPILDDVDEIAADPIQALADKYLATPCSVMTPNTTRLDSIRRLAREFRADCIVDLIWQACLTYDIESVMVRKLADEELRLPFLRIQTDYSPSDSERIAVRVEALFENVRRKAASPGAKACRAT
ncbi:MAG: double-cubane-cluster-containing anaerobic reductase [Verrucomicrobiae bacterium]